MKAETEGKLGPPDRLPRRRQHGATLEEPPLQDGAGIQTHIR